MVRQVVAIGGMSVRRLLTFCDDETTVQTSRLIPSAPKRRATASYSPSVIPGLPFADEVALHRCPLVPAPVRLVDAVAERTGHGFSAPIVGATKPHHLPEAIAALDLHLTHDEIRSLEELGQTWVASSSERCWSICGM
jgi:hypothetical protein